MVDINKEFKKWGNRVSIHAIPFIASGQKKFLRVVWIVSLLLSIGLCIALLITIITQYFQYEVNTVFQIERDAERSFPTISFCSKQICGLNSYKTEEYLASFLRQTYDLKNWTVIDYKDPFVQSIMDSMSWSKDEVYNGILRAYFNKTLSINQTDIKDRILSCEFNGEQCDYTEFETYNLNDYQKCYRFNSGKFSNGTTNPIKTTERYGISYGLHLELFLGKSADCPNPFSKTSGLILYIHNSSYMVTEELMQNGIEIPMGTETNIGRNAFKLE